MTTSPDGTIPAAGRGLGVALDALSVATAAELRTSGVVITVMAAGAAEASVGSSGGTVRAWEQLQLDVGEGPSRSAFATGLSQAVPDLESEDALVRWPGYVSQARRAGLRSVHAFPLQLGASRLGALTAYGSRPGRLSSASLRVCLAAADRATALILAGETEWCADDPGSDDVFQLPSEVYQAQGMVMAQLGCSLAEALARLRGHAYAGDLTLTELAAEVLEGRTRFGPETPVARPPP